MKTEISKNIMQAISVLNGNSFVKLYHDFDFELRREYFLGLFPVEKKYYRVPNFFHIYAEYINGVAPDMYYDSMIRAWLTINGNTDFEIDPIRRESAKSAIRRQWRDRDGHNPHLEHLRIHPEGGPGIYVHPYNYLMMQAVLEGYRDNNPNRPYTDKLNFD